MALIGQVCTKGVWDETVPGITFDENGVSNYAKIFQKLLDDFPRGEVGKKQWLTTVEEIKKAGEGKTYDCIIGLSGGTDSSYLLHLAKEYDLRPLAVNLDNGWSSDIAVKNMKKMTSALNIDLETYVIDYQEVIDVLSAYLRAKLPWADNPTDEAIRAILYKKAQQEKIKHILIGHDFRTEGFQPTEWTYGDAKQLNYVAKKFSGRNIKSFPNLSIWKFGFLAFIKGIKMVKPFFYLPYNKGEVKLFLTQKYGWEDYGGHHYENIFTKFIISYWLVEKYGIDKRKITLSALLLSGEVLRKDVLEELSKKPFDENQINKDIDYILKKLNMTKEEFDNLFKGEKKYFYDYPSYYPLFGKFKKVIFPLMKYFLPNKPLMFYQMESRKKNHNNSN